MYEVPSEERPGCRDAAVLTRAVFAILLPPLLAMIAVLGSIAVVIVLFTVHPALALLPVAAVALGVWLYARWEQRRYRPPRL